MSSAKLIEVIKLAGLQAAEASKPVNIFEGKVIRKLSGQTVLTRIF